MNVQVKSSNGIPLVPVDSSRKIFIEDEQYRQITQEYEKKMAERGRSIPSLPLNRISQTMYMTSGH